MSRIAFTVRVRGDGDDDVHLPGVIEQGTVTVCGFVDVEHDILDPEEHPPTCRSCVRIVRRLRKMMLPSGKPV